MVALLTVVFEAGDKGVVLGGEDARVGVVLSPDGHLVRGSHDVEDRLQHVHVLVVVVHDAPILVPVLVARGVGDAAERDEEGERAEDDGAD